MVFTQDNGNLTEKGTHNTASSSDPVSFSTTEGEYWKYGYDLLNRLLNVSKSDSGSANAQLIAEYLYDYQGYRILKTKTEDGVTETERYVFDLGGNLLSKTKDGQSYEDYIYAFGKIIAKRTGSNNTFETEYYLTDHLGTVIMITDDTGNIIWENDYDPFGESRGEFGTDRRTKIYTGKEFDEDIGLYYSNARWYDPSLGRFITEDPIKDGMNWYLYCLNNPLRFFDPDGTDLKDIQKRLKNWLADNGKSAINDFRRKITSR